jgi:hypothetical protein
VKSKGLPGKVVVVRYVRVVLGIDERRLARGGSVGRDERPMVVGVGRGRLRRRARVSRVGGELAPVARHQVPDPAGEDGQVVRETRLAVEILDVTFHADAVVVLDGVDLGEHLAAPGVDPVDPAVRQALGRDTVEVAPALGIDHHSDGAGAGGTDVAGRLAQSRGLRELDRVSRRDRRIARADDRPHGSRGAPVHAGLAAQHVRASGAVDLLIALVRSATEVEFPDELHVRRDRVARRGAPAQRLEFGVRGRRCAVRR